VASNRNQIRCSASSIQFSNRLALATSLCSSQSACVSRRALVIHWRQSDWGVFQQPGAFERMQSTACTQMRGVHLIDGAGHWVEQEQPEEVSQLLVRFFQSAA
jgi:pimeloyl-ACP methyl ester carboxylesterase